MDMSASTIAYFIDHLFLPPRIGASSRVNNKSELNLVSFVHEAVSQFQAGGILASPMAIERIDRIVKMLGVMAELQALPPGSNELQLSLMKAFMGMEEGDIVALHVIEHNAAVIFHNRGATVRFSSFVVSRDTPGSSARRRYSYPATVVSIPVKIFSLQGFLEQLATLLTSLSASQLSDAESAVYITEFLTSLLRGIGEGVSLDTHDGGQILKRATGIQKIGVRNGKPWSRSPIWLVIRVTLQICLVHTGVDASRHSEYKLLILYILAKLLEVGSLPDNYRLKWLGEKLCHMSRKLTYRAAKLEAAGLAIPTMLLQYVSTTVRCAVGVLEKQFEEARVKGLRWPQVGELGIDQDTDLTMLKSRSYIRGVLAGFDRRTVHVGVFDSFSKNEPSRVFYGTSPFQVILNAVKDLNTMKDLNAEKDPGGGVGAKDNKVVLILLKDIELWVETTLGDYVNTNSNCEEACCELYQLFTLYSRAASSLYKNNPVDRSLMYLTEVELWIAIDKITTAIIPLLKEYPCDVNPDHFTALLLPTNNQLKRLHNVTIYLEARRTQAIYPSICTGYLGTTRTVRDIVNNKEHAETATVAGHTFSVRYFDQSPMHQALYDTIVSSGSQDAMKTAWRVGSLRSRMEAPFVSQKTQTKAIIFELDPPIAFVVWRAVTIEYYAEVSDFRSNSSIKVGYPEQLEVINRFLWPDDNIDINSGPTLLPIAVTSASYTYHIPQDSILNGHYSRLLGASERIPARLRHCNSTVRYSTSPVPEITDKDDRDICICPFKVMAVDSGKKSFKLEVNWHQANERYVSLVGSWKSRVLGRRGVKRYTDVDLSTGHVWVADMRDSCTFKLPSSCNSVQYFVGSTDHTSNGVICNQSWRPDGWPVHEYYSFALLRAGSRLQWLNILREIQAGNLSLNRVEFVYLFLQACWQAGPRGVTDTHLWETHEILLDVDFCNHILDALEGSLTGIRENWLQQMSMQLVICLGARVLSLTRDCQIKARASYFLKICRAACMDWLLDIIQRIHSSSNDETRKQWQARGLAVAATCRQTFDVDLDVIFTVLNSERDLGDFIECAACVHNAAPEDATGHEHFHLLTRDARLAHVMERHLRDLVFTNNDWFHYAIARVLPDYVVGGQWDVLLAPDDRWITTKSGGEVPMSVHYNLLEGTVLVDGIPLGSLPKVYMEHPLYKRVFNNQSFFVVKTAMPGMQFQTVYSVCVSGPHVTVYFGIRNEELVIRAKRDDDVHEIIPHTVLDGDFPEAMLSPYLHLLDLNRPKLEFRPLKNDDSLWESSNGHWVVTISEWEGLSWSARGQHMHNPELRLIDYHSPTQAALAEIFQSIEGKSHIQLTFSPMDKKVHLKLARYGLEFDFDGTQAKDTQIACRTFPGMVVDMRPRIGQDMQTLYGLKTYLVLREAEFPPSNARRTVIIPYGEVKYVAEEHSTSVWIDTGSMTTIQYYIFSIDTLLGRLVSDGSTQSLLYKAYLHALTSYSVPDPLTGMTGTQQALDDLRSARVWSFQKFNDWRLFENSTELKMLRLLSYLTPTESSMYQSLTPALGAPPVQRVNWDPNLPIFCQATEFYFIAESILLHWQNSAKIQGLVSAHKGYPLWDPKARGFDVSKGRDSDVPEMLSIREAGYRTYDHGGDPLFHNTDTKPDQIYPGRAFSHPGLEESVCSISRITNQWTTKLKPTPILQNIISKWKRLGSVADKTIEYHYSLHQAPLAEYWCALYEFCRSCSQENDKYRLLFVLSAFAYSAGRFATVPRLFKQTSLEQKASELARKAHGLWKKGSELEKKASEIKLEPEKRKLLLKLRQLRKRVDTIEERVGRLGERSKDKIVVEQGKRTLELLETLVAIATNPTFSALPLPVDSLGLVNHHTESEGWIKHTEEVQHRLNIIRHRARYDIIGHLTKRHPPLSASERHGVILAPQSPALKLKIAQSLHDLLYATPPPASQINGNTPTEPHIDLSPPRESNSEVLDLDPLKELLNRFSLNAIGFHQRYSEDLERSWRALQTYKLSAMNKPSVTLPAIHQVEAYMRQSEDHMQNILSRIVTILTKPDALTVDQLLYTAGFQRRISAKSMLALLRGTNADDLGKVPGWKQILMSFGRTVTLYQRATRMYRATWRGDPVHFTKEWENRGHMGWDSLELSEWLLFEIENDLLIRPMQAAIAKEMASPHTQRNAVMQLNMGEGKSSVIVPIVAAALADRQKFVRIVVLKPLWNQMFDLLAQKLGGLLNRRIYHVPFSRSSANPGVQDMFKECMENGGIFLTQPEHILSFKLQGVEWLYNRQGSWGTTFRNSWQTLRTEIKTPKNMVGELRKMHAAQWELLKTQHWLDQNARDIFDESDELLHARYELIYTIGGQQPLELGTRRWVMIQEILTLVRKHMRVLVQQYPLGLELIERQSAPGSFPFARLLEKDAEVLLMGEVASEMITTKLGDWVPQEHISGQLPECVLSYVVDSDAKEDILSGLEVIPPPILLLKGLIGHGIIAFVLREKKWRVDYGLDLRTTRLAVPYRAKDSPVPGAQFAHPDIKITLTCMCYYYQGLTESQLRVCFRRLEGFIDPDTEYDDWIMECEVYLPPPLRHLNGVNLDDAHQWSHTLYPLLKMTKKVIDFYLSHEVFPTGCQEFRAKLSTSAWDLAEERKHPTTGFSGTNDTRYLLPISIEQLDLDTQAHTNAKVLSYLLRSENRFYQCMQTPDGKRLSAREILQKIVNPQHHLMGQIQVLVDVGAQVLDMDNEEVARYWLWAAGAAHANSEWTAALFFNANGELTVVGKDNRMQPYISSPYFGNMASCLVYLDEAHTRGTDIKLPANSVAAVTLGTKLAKDKLVQACMRMRNLGYGQSVCFFAPPEVHRKILYHMKTGHESSQDKQVETIDVLCWVMHESVTQTQQNFTLWASQGIDYQTRRSIAFPSMWKTHINYKQFTAAWKKADSKTLTEMYSTSDRDSSSIMCIIDRKVNDSRLQKRKKELLAIRLRCEEHQITHIRELSLQELQEREVIRETIQECSPVDEPRPRIGPCTHKLHLGLAKFIGTGVPPADSGTLGSPFCSLMDTLTQTSFSNFIERERWESNILTTQDFASTVKTLRHHWYSMPEFNDLQTDLYLRPVTWVLSTGALQEGRLTLIILSPFEVNELLPQIRKSKFVNLHMYSAKMKRPTPDFYDLTSLAIPALPDKHKWQTMYPETEGLMIQINLYAGELFFGSYEVYCKACEFLGICVGEGETPILHPVGCQGIRRMVGCQVGKVTFQRSQLKFLKHLVEARRRGIDVDHTHMDCLLRWRLLQPRDWKVRVVDSGHEELSDTEDVGEQLSLGGRDIVGDGKCRRCGQDVLWWGQDREVGQDRVH